MPGLIKPAWAGLWGIPQFQIEVGFANLAFGIAGLTAAALWWGPLACGIALFTYGLYMACALMLHISEAMGNPEGRKRASMKIANAALFAIALLGFAALALGIAGIMP